MFYNRKIISALSDRPWTFLSLKVHRRRTRSGRYSYSKTCLKRTLKKEDEKLFFRTDNRLMQNKSIAECSNSAAIFPTSITLSFAKNKTKMSNFELPPKTGFTVYCKKCNCWAELALVLMLPLNCFNPFMLNGMSHPINWTNPFRIEGLLDSKY